MSSGNVIEDQLVESYPVYVPKIGTGGNHIQVIENIINFLQGKVNGLSEDKLKKIITGILNKEDLSSEDTDEIFSRLHHVRRKLKKTKKSRKLKKN
jgi:hypothetical protein